MSQRKLLLWMVLLLLIAPQRMAAQTDPDYTLSHYTATFELVENEAHELRDMRVTLEITYDIAGGPKSEGFKFIGTESVRDISVTDSEGAPLEYRLEALEENRITWYFPARTGGEQTVVVRFTLADMLNGSLEANYFSCDWVKNWKVPVYDATYRFILPDDYMYLEFSMTPGKPTLVEEDGRRIMEVHQDELSDTALHIRFAPGLVEVHRPLHPALAVFGVIVNFICCGVGISIMATIPAVARFFTRIGKGREWRKFQRWLNSGNGKSNGGGCGGGGCGGGGCGGCGG